MNNKTIKIFAIVAILLAIVLGMVNSVKASIDMNDALRKLEEPSSLKPEVEKTSTLEIFAIVVIAISSIILLIIAIVVMFIVIK